MKSSSRMNEIIYPIMLVSKDCLGQSFNDMDLCNFEIYNR